MKCVFLIELAIYKTVSGLPRIFHPMQEMWVPHSGREDPLEEAWQPTPEFLPGESQGQRSLAGYGPRVVTNQLQRSTGQQRQLIFNAGVGAD